MWFLSFVLINLRHRMARTMLTAGGIAVAIATAVVLLGVSHDFQQSAQDSLSSGGVEILVVQEGVLDQLSSDLDANLADRIRDISGVNGVSPGLLELIDYSKSSDVISVLVQGWEPTTFLFEELKFLEGQPYTSDDERVVLLGKTLSDNIKKHVGETVVIQREEFKVVGVYQSYNVFENGAMTVPLKQLQHVMFREDSATGFSVRLDHAAMGEQTTEDICKQINELVDDEGRSYGVAAMPTQDYVSNSVYLKTAHAMAWLTSLIAVAVGSFGMLNTMLMSVIERIREISILRAIGWRRGRIVRMIMSECFFISLVGAAIGSVIAVLFTKWLATLPAVSGFVRGDVAWDVLQIGLALAMGVALVGGAYPAYQASKLQPAEGLSHE